LVTGGVLVGCVWIWRADVDHRLKGAALITGVLLSSPYVLDYDLVVFGMALALLAAHGFERGFLRWEKTLLALGWFMPVCARSIAQLAYLPLGFFMLAAIFILLVVRVRARRREAGEAAHARTAPSKSPAMLPSTLRPQASR